MVSCEYGCGCGCENAVREGAPYPVRSLISCRFLSCGTVFWCGPLSPMGPARVASAEDDAAAADVPIVLVSVCLVWAVLFEVSGSRLWCGLEAEDEGREPDCG